MKIIEKNLNVETGEETLTEREMTPTELAEFQQNQIFIQERIEAQTQVAAAKAALLERLGITEDEAKLLVGGTLQ